MPLRVSRMRCSVSAISAFTRVHSASKTRVTALTDALWRETVHR